MTPQRSNLVLTSNIPNIKFYIFVSNGLHIKSNSWDSCNGLTKFKFVQNSWKNDYSYNDVYISCKHLLNLFVYLLLTIVDQNI